MFTCRLPKNALLASAVAAIMSLPLVFGSAPAKAAITLFINDDVGFALAAGPLTLETFVGPGLVSGLTIGTTNGIVVNNGGFFGGGYFDDTVVNNSATTTFTFSHPVTSFGGYWDQTPDNFGQGMKFTMTGNVLVTELDQFSLNFFGFTSTTAFNSVIVSGGNFGGNPSEHYALEQLQFSSGVPETSTWIMMLLGFAGIGFAGARKRKIAALAA